MMNNPLPDPWLDAAALAHALQSPQAQLCVILGAQAWCSKCRLWYPHFIAFAAEHPDLTCLWLDLDDHAEFLDGFIPADLPLLLCWRGGQLSAAQPLSKAGDSAELAALCAQNTSLPDQGWPNLWQRFCKVDWGS